MEQGPCWPIFLFNPMTPPVKFVDFGAPDQFGAHLFRVEIPASKSDAVMRVEDYGCRGSEAGIPCDDVSEMDRRRIEVPAEVEALLHKQRYRKLHDLLTSGRVEIRVVPKDRVFLHGKAGVIETAAGSKTSFLGSINETKSAFAGNYQILWQGTAAVGRRSRCRQDLVARRERHPLQRFGLEDQPSLRPRLSGGHRFHLRPSETHQAGRVHEIHEVAAVSRAICGEGK
jgi:hypothetical protein